MKVETPQLRWHQIASATSKKDEGHNGPILSCSLLTLNDQVGVLATVGNAEVNLWRVGFTQDEARLPSADSSGDNDDNCNGAPRRNRILVQPQTSNGPAATAQALAEHTRIEHIVTLSRGTTERSVNAVKFSPSGAHLVAAGDGGTVVVFSVPNGDPFSWNRVVQESDLPMKILFNRSDDVMDVAWSADSKRFVVCSLDHSVAVWERGDKEEWKAVHRSTKDHTHYVQGVAVDPKGVYLASMGSDRMVKVYARKNVKDSAVKGELAKYEVETQGDAEGEGKEQEAKDKKAIVQSKVLPDLLTSSNFALQKQVKTMKFLQPAKPTGKDSAPAAEGKDPAAEANGRTSPVPVKRHHMFADELTLGSFFRRLAFTPDGAFLAVPAALWHGSGDGKSGAPTSPTSVANAEKLAESSFATYLFARHRYDQPYKVLTGLEKPSVVVRPNPVLFELPKDAKQSPLPHRSVLAVLTNDSVLIYDTHHDRPLAVARGLHYAGLTDAAWSSDGKTLFVTSSDGYLSILSFANGELGEVHVPPEVKVVEKAGETGAAAVGEKAGPAVPSTGADATARVAINTLVGKKKDKADSSPSSDSAEAGGEGKKVKFSPVNEVKQIEARQEPVINTLVGKKKKKKVAPTLVAPDTATPAQEPTTSEKDGAEATATEEKKRSSEEIESPPDMPEEPLVNVLLPKKKKKKVSGSSTPVATM